MSPFHPQVLGPLSVSRARSLDLWTRGVTKVDFPAINLFARCHGGIQLLEHEHDDENESPNFEI
jgi:hypothetical protein